MITAISIITAIIITATTTGTATTTTKMRRDEARRDEREETRRDKTRRDETRRDETRQDEAFACTYSIFELCIDYNWCVHNPSLYMLYIANIAFLVRVYSAFKLMYICEFKLKFQSCEVHNYY